MLVTLHTQGDRIIVGDLQESFHYVKYRAFENALFIFADHFIPHHITASAQLDYDTMCGADKFGNIFLTRLSQEVAENVEEDPTGANVRWDRSFLNGAPHKAQVINYFHVGEMITGLARTSLVPGGREAIIYCTMMGSIGALLPFTSREDIDFFQHLEMHLRQENPPLFGRDHLSFRSYYFPVKDVIDGDMCEQFALLDPEKQRSIASELDRSVPEVLKKLEDIRNRLL